MCSPQQCSGQCCAALLSLCPQIYQLFLTCPREGVELECLLKLIAYYIDPIYTRLRCGKVFCCDGIVSAYLCAIKVYLGSSTPDLKSLSDVLNCILIQATGISITCDQLINLPPNCRICTIPPEEIPCDNFTKGFGDRYRSFRNSGGEEVYLGRGDIGMGVNRVAAQYTWSDPNSGTYNFTFTHSVANDYIVETLVNTSTLTTPSPNPLYYPSNAGGLITALNANAPPININNLNAFEILVNNQEDDTTVVLSNLVLTTTGGSYPLGPYAPPVNSQIIKKYSWPVDGSSPAQDFTFSGTIFLNGDFSGGTESTRVEISIIRCLDPQ